jgi:hypothetical protein
MKEAVTDEIRKMLDENVVLPLWPETGRLLGLGRGTTYSAAAKGDIKVIKFNRLKKVPTAWLKAKLGLDGPATS